jgi:CheY-like chemotaxis protein
MAKKKDDLILIAIDDKDDSVAILNILKENKYASIDTNDGAKAMELALKEEPSVIVIDLDLPVISGQRLFEILGRNPNTSRLPFIFLSKAAKDVKGFRVGIDAFFTKPLKFEEILESIKKTLLDADDVAAMDTKDIQGKLSQVSLVDILQILHYNQKEGELVITDGSTTGTIQMKDGQIYNAILGEIEKEKALFRLFTWKEGIFEFQPRAVTSAQRIDGSAGHLLMEGMRQLDEMEKGKGGSFPSPESTLRTKVDTAALPKGLKPIIYEIIFLLDYYPKVEDLVDHCTFTDFDVYTTIVSLINRNILEEVKGTGEAGTNPSYDFVPPTQAIRIKEKVVHRWGEMLDVNFGKLFVITTDAVLAKDFLISCKNLPEFKLDSRLLDASDEGFEHVGQMGTLEIYGDMKIIFYNVPTDKLMAPLLKALSSNLIGILMIWDKNRAPDSEFISMLGETKKQILSMRRVPYVNVFAGDALPEATTLEHYRRALHISKDEEIFNFNYRESDVAEKALKAFFNSLVKDDYITGTSSV